MGSPANPTLTASGARIAARRHLHTQERVRSTGCDVHEHPHGGFLVTITTPQGARLFRVTLHRRGVRVEEEE